jgi:hypothetical protein
MRIPDDWVDPPVLPLHLVWVRDAYYKLSTCRQSGFGITPVPWTAIVSYAQYMELDEYDTDWFVDTIESLDEQVMAYIKAKQDAEKPKQ